MVAVPGRSSPAEAALETELHVAIDAWAEWFDERQLLGTLVCSMPVAVDYAYCDRHPSPKVA